MKNYRFRTSSGYVYIKFDPEQVKPRDFPGSGNTTVTIDCCEEFELGQGKEKIQEMYDGCVHRIARAPDGSLWVDIELSDAYYGSPEYLLELDPAQPEEQE